MLTFKDNVKENTPKEYTIGIVVYIENVFYANVKDTLYEIDYQICNYTTVYSKPNNDKYSAWTEKKNKIISNSKAEVYWSPFKPGMRIQGNIIKNKFVEKKSKIKKPCK